VLYHIAAPVGHAYFLIVFVRFLRIFIRNSIFKRVQLENFGMIRRLAQTSQFRRSISVRTAIFQLRSGSIRTIFLYLQILSQLWHGPQATAGGADAEKRLQTLLRQAFPKAGDVQVADISGTDSN